MYRSQPSTELSLWSKHEAACTSSTCKNAISGLSFQLLSKTPVSIVLKYRWAELEAEEKAFTEDEADYFRGAAMYAYESFRNKVAI